MFFWCRVERKSPHLGYLGVDGGYRSQLAISTTSACISLHGTGTSKHGTSCVYLQTALVQLCPCVRGRSLSWDGLVTGWQCHPHQRVGAHKARDQSRRHPARNQPPTRIVRLYDVTAMPLATDYTLHLHSVCVQVPILPLPLPSCTISQGGLRARSPIACSIG